MQVQFGCYFLAESPTNKNHYSADATLTKLKIAAEKFLNVKSYPFMNDYDFKKANNYIPNNVYMYMTRKSIAMTGPTLNFIKFFNYLKYFFNIYI